MHINVNYVYSYEQFIIYFVVDCQGNPSEVPCIITTIITVYDKLGDYVIV